MAGGRPTKYNESIVQKAWEYINGGWEDVGDAIPSAVGLAVVLNLAESTLYCWADEEDKEFSEILAHCKTRQHHRLLNGGLNGDLNSNIVKLVLGKHDYSDKQDLSGSMVVDDVTELSATERASRVAAILDAARARGAGSPTED